MWEVIKSHRIACHDCDCDTLVASMAWIRLGWTNTIGGEEVAATALVCRSCEWDYYEAQNDR
jgi:hypothetical protein